MSRSHIDRYAEMALIDAEWAAMQREHYSVSGWLKRRTVKERWTAFATVVVLFFGFVLYDATMYSVQHPIQNSLYLEGSPYAAFNSQEGSQSQAPVAGTRSQIWIPKDGYWHPDMAVALSQEKQASGDQSTGKPKP